MKLREMYETISPLLIETKATSITLGLSKRFFLFTLMGKIFKRIEDDPYLNFISLLKYYKVLGNFLTGTLREFHRDRNKPYFRHFFPDEQIYELVKADIKRLVREHPNVRATMTKKGIIIYDNYQKDKFNTLLFTIHSGTWIPENIREKFHLSAYERRQEEDVGSHRIYSSLVLKNNGIWIDNKQSRFACDFNRPEGLAVYRNNQERWAARVWRRDPLEWEREELLGSYKEFYFLLEKIIDAYRFNVILDGHTMGDDKDRANISFGTAFIPRFYMPIVEKMREQLNKKGYAPVSFNAPYYGGHILHTLKEKHPDLFICFIEINKKLYMNQGRDRIYDGKLALLSRNLTSIFDLEMQEGAIKGYPYYAPTRRPKR